MAVFRIGEEGQFTGAGILQRADAGNHRGTGTEQFSAEAGDYFVKPQRHGQRRSYLVPSPSALITLSVMSMRGLA